MHIAVIDSGLGGMTVLEPLLKNFSEHRFTYFGDSARVPYGTKSVSVIQRYVLEIFKTIHRKDPIDILVLACNSASAAFGESLSTLLPVPTIGVIEAGVAAARTPRKSSQDVIGVIGTEATIRSGAYRNAFRKAFAQSDDKPELWFQACPLFVPLVEEGWLDDAITEKVIQRYMANAPATMNTLVLGCTHYPLLEKAFNKLYPQLRLCSSADAIVDFLETQHKLKPSPQHRNTVCTLLFSDLRSLEHNWVQDFQLRWKCEARVQSVSV